MEVVTQPDEPVGRKQILTSPPVKVEAEKFSLPVYQPKILKSSDAEEHFKKLKPDLVVVAAYGKMIPSWLLELPPCGCLNIHPSLLPKYRGPSPIQSAILNGDEETGVTIILLDEEMDHGDVVSSIKYQVLSIITSKQLSQALAESGAKLLVEILPDWLDNKVKPRPQDHEKVTFTKLLTREDGKVNWCQPAAAIERMARAYGDWPGIWTTWNGKRLKLLKISILNKQVGCANNPAPGYVWQTDEQNKKLAVNTQPGSIVLEQIQLEGRESMSGQEFLRGYPKFLGSVLG